MSKKKSEVILPAKKQKAAKTEAKKPKKSLTETIKPKKKMKLYSNLSYKKKVRKEAAQRRRAEELAKLPKEPWKRFFARLSPKRFFKWWFSWRGQKAILKFFAACILLFIIFIGGLFLYYKKDLQEIKLNEMQISETVNTYLDRNGKVLWKDTGNEDYRLVVDSSEMSDYVKQATVAIEDKSFYDHSGVDFKALIRATWSTLFGHQVQGGSTLTQQLIKQVYFSDEASSANRGGLTRKIKELILAIELERMYSKEEILTMYLNQSPYGGRRNGVESAAQTYFGKSSKDLTLAEAALLAGIPNNPGMYNPYNTAGNEALLERQHKTLDNMAEMGYITKEEAEEAKAVPILDTIKPESSQYSDMLAPHFVLEVKNQLEEKYGISTMRAGGWTITTTLDYDLQMIAEESLEHAMQWKYSIDGDNLAMTSIDVETSQVMVMIGSIDFNNAEYGELNATTSLLEPGSSIKPLLDYAPLFMERDGMNYGPGTYLKDENIDSIYCNGYTNGGCRLRNASGIFYPSAHIRQSLGSSLNIPAVKALYINGIDNSLDVLHQLGDVSYCSYGETAGLSMAIGSGCRVKMVEHANAYASIARGGAYKDLAYVLEVKNSSGDIIEKWEDKPAKQVVDPQVAYMISDILSDPTARRLMGWTGYEFGFNVPGVWTACKTGTTTTAVNLTPKDSWLMNYSTALATGVWVGNHDGSGMYNADSRLLREWIGTFTQRAHTEVLANNGKWSEGDQPARPAGIKTLTVNGTTDIWPSWYEADKNSGNKKETLTFNRYNKLLATECTRDDFKIEIGATKFVDPVSKKETWTLDDESYNREEKDTCDYVPPSVTLTNDDKTLIAKISLGSNNISGYTLYVNGQEFGSVSVDNATGVVKGYTLKGTETSVRLTISDTAGYYASSEITLTPSASSDSGQNSGEQNP
ncbi:MAG: transglycosylase domain-containing protein [Candidatus Saccharibacteria bacterium]|nr:transglycosylase domain-containing protein [Candidatus Saccharibacteria bacterium]